jgi:hypothetical protein
MQNDHKQAKQGSLHDRTRIPEAESQKNSIILTQLPSPTLQGQNSQLFRDIKQK